LSIQIPIDFVCSFETIFTDDILKILDIPLADILNIGPYFTRGSAKGDGLQIDMLIMRRNQIWTIVECKFSTNPIGPSVINQVEEKIRRMNIPPLVTIEKVLIAANGTTPKVAKEEYFNNIITLKELI